jgi:hypothetical protein
VANPDVGEPAALLSASEGFGQTEVAVPHHAENGVDAPPKHHVDHLIHQARRLDENR